MSPDVGDLVFVFVAHVEEEQVFALVKTALQVFSLDFRDTHFGGSPFAPKTQNPPASSSSGGGSLKDSIEVSLLALQSPRARRHVPAAHTGQTTRRHLLGAKIHVTRIA
jgi:hypothetical protein